MEKNDNILRPNYLNEYVGQEEIKKQIEIDIMGAKIRDEVIRHTVFYGGAGLGKTSLARVIANEVGSNVVPILGSLIKEKHELISALIQLEKGDIVFIDEIHSVPKYIQEILYPAMEDFSVSLVHNDNNITYELEPFTLIGATTNLGLLTKPLRERFHNSYEIKPYEDEELKKIILASSKKIKSEITDDAAMNIARRSRGTPRIANNFLLKLHDYSLVDAQKKNKDPIINDEVCENTFNLLKIDKNGLNDLERRVLKSMHETYNNRPVGSKSLSLSTNIDQNDIENIIEPFLIQKEYIIRGPKGRQLTQKGISYIESVS